MDVKTANTLYDACDLIDRASQTIRRPTVPVIPDYYAPLGALVSITRAIRNFLNTLPHLTEFQPGEYYDSQGGNPGESMERAEFALADALTALTTLNSHLNTAWSHIGRLGVTTTD